MPYLSCKFKHISSSSPIITYREVRQDYPPAQVQEQEDPTRQEEEEDPNSGHLLRLQGLQEEAGANDISTSSTIWATAALPQRPKTSSGQYSAVVCRSYRQPQKGDQDE